MAVGKEETQFDVIRAAAELHEIPLLRGYGAFLAYFPGNDRLIDPEERRQLRAVDNDTSRPEDYKIHFNPSDEQLIDSFAALVELSRASPVFRRALYEMKIWFGGDEAVDDDVPRLVLYPSGGGVIHAQTVANQALQGLLKHFKGRVNGSGREPRFNIPIVPGYCFMAQGDGGEKQENPNYLEKFDPNLNFAALKESVGELSLAARAIQSNYSRVVEFRYT